LDSPSGKIDRRHPHFDALSDVDHRGGNAALQLHALGNVIEVFAQLADVHEAFDERDVELDPEAPAIDTAYGSVEPAADVPHHVEHARRLHDVALGIHCAAFARRGVLTRRAE